jgi:hypothetical protein
MRNTPIRARNDPSRARLGGRSSSRMRLDLVGSQAGSVRLASRTLINITAI